MDYSLLLISLIASVCTLVGVVLGGYLSYYANRRKEFLVALKRQHREACEQIKAHCNLETIYSEALAELSDRAMDAAQKEMRAQMHDSDYVRPMWSERNAQASINRFC